MFANQALENFVSFFRNVKEHKCSLETLIRKMKEGWQQMQVMNALVSQLANPSFSNFAKFIGI